MKKILKVSGIFLVGLLVGAILMNLLHMYVSSMYHEVIRTHLKVDEEFLASRSKRENNKLETAFHRWAAVNAESEAGFRVFRRTDNKMEDDSFFYPVGLLFLKWAYNPEKLKRGCQITEGMTRGKFAVALEAIGETVEANRQWQLARQMTQFKDIEATKKLIYGILEQEKTDSYIQAEKKILGEINEAQQKN